MVLSVFAWSNGQMGQGVVNSIAFVVSKGPSVVSSIILCVLAWSKEGNFVNSHVFVGFCMAEKRKQCFHVLMHGRREEIS